MFDSECTHRYWYRYSDPGSVVSTSGTCSDPSPFYSNGGMPESLCAIVGSPRCNRYVQAAQIRVKLILSLAHAFYTYTDEGWRWCYYLNAIFSFLSLVGLFISYHPPTYHQLHNHPTEDPPTKDWAGLLIFTIAVALVLYPLGWGKLIWSTYLFFHQLKWNIADLVEAGILPSLSRFLLLVVLC